MKSFHKMCTHFIKSNKKKNLIKIDITHIAAVHRVKINIIISCKNNFIYLLTVRLNFLLLKTRSSGLI